MYDFRSLTSLSFLEYNIIFSISLPHVELFSVDREKLKFSDWKMRWSEESDRKIP